MEKRWQSSALLLSPVWNQSHPKRHPSTIMLAAFLALVVFVVTHSRGTALAEPISFERKTGSLEVSQTKANISSCPGQI
jgi:hypothetical protein